MKKAAPYGSWKSPVTPEFVSGKDRALTPHIQADGETIYFIESRPDEAGRAVLMVLQPDGKAKEVLPPQFDVRTRYLEYGGLSFLVSEGVCFFVHFADQEIYVAEPGKPPRQLTREKGNRFADFSLDRKRNRLLALREVPAQPESKNSICAIDLATGRVEDLVTGADFYNSARVRGDQLLWISWNHPNMPWNGTELWLGDLNHLDAPQKIVGDSQHSVAQARWTVKGDILFAAELGDYMNLYRSDNGKISAFLSRESDFTLPDWVPGSSQYAILDDGSICATYADQSRWRIVQIDANGISRVVERSFALVGALHACRDFFVALVGHSDQPGSLVAIYPSGEVMDLYSPPRVELSADTLSFPEEIRYPTADGGVGFAWFYAPKNADWVGLEGEMPPLIVCAHGGPTAMSPSSFRKDIQFWTSRGYAVVDVNYGGSSGYGRKYRERLRLNWGLVDVSDCVAAVKKLSDDGLVDSRRVAIRGGSAGGYTTLAALAFTKGIFTVGASYFGVSDLELLAKETHKLESRYLDQLVGPYPGAIAVYKARAPREHIDQLNCLIIFFQGDEDKVVPPNQSELMYNALKEKGIPTEYHLYSKEGHGFRRSETNQHALKAEHGFYARSFRFEVQVDDRL